MNYLNPNSFGAQTIDQSDAHTAAQLVIDGQLFRYNKEGVDSYNDRFETELASFLGNRVRAVTMCNGTAALRAALKACKVQAGDRVGVSALTFIATASAVLSLGAVPIPIDLDPQLGVDLEDLETKLPILKGVVFVYIPGHAVNAAQVVRLAQSHGAFTIEDACQALGVRCQSEHAGSIADLGVFSFQQNKQITCGEGGVVVGNGELLDRVRCFADHGADRVHNGPPSWSDTPDSIGENLRLTEIQAALLSAQLKRLPQMLERQRTAKQQIQDLLKAEGIPVIESHDPDGDSGQYLALLPANEPQSEQLISSSAEYGVLLKHFWRKPITAFAGVRASIAATGELKHIHCPRASTWSARLVALPLPPTLSGERLAELKEQLLTWVKLKEVQSLWA